MNFDCLIKNFVVYILLTITISLPKRYIFTILKIGITIVDDNQWEPDEEFFVKLTLIPGEDSENVKLGKTCIMEITILNDDGRHLYNRTHYKKNS